MSVDYTSLTYFVDRCRQLIKKGKKLFLTFEDDVIDIHVRGEDIYYLSIYRSTIIVLCESEAILKKDFTHKNLRKIISRFVKIKR